MGINKGTSPCTDSYLIRLFYSDVKGTGVAMDTRADPRWEGKGGQESALPFVLENPNLIKRKVTSQVCPRMNCLLIRYRYQEPPLPFHKFLYIVEVYRPTLPTVVGRNRPNNVLE